MRGVGPTPPLRNGEDSRRSEIEHAISERLRSRSPFDETQRCLLQSRERGGSRSRRLL